MALKTTTETLRALNVHHVLTASCHPQSNAKVQRFHRTLHDVMSNIMTDDSSILDWFLSQALAAIMFNVSDSTKSSPFLLLFNRDVVLPLDNILEENTWVKITIA